MFNNVYVASPEDARNELSHGPVTSDINFDSVANGMHECGVGEYYPGARGKENGYSIVLFGQVSAFPLHDRLLHKYVGTFNECGKTIRDIGGVVNKAWRDIDQIKEDIRERRVWGIPEITIWMPQYITKHLWTVICAVIDIAAQECTIASIGDCFPDIPSYGYVSARLDFIGNAEVHANSSVHGYNADLVVTKKVTTSSTPLRWADIERNTAFMKEGVLHDGIDRKSTKGPTIVGADRTGKKSGVKKKPSHEAAAPPPTEVVSSETTLEEKSEKEETSATEDNSGILMQWIDDEETEDIDGVDDLPGGPTASCSRSNSVCLDDDSNRILSAGIVTVA